MNIVKRQLPSLTMEIKMVKKVTFLATLTCIPAISLAGGSFWKSFGGAIAGNVVYNTARDIFSTPRTQVYTVRQPQCVEVHKTVYTPAINTHEDKIDTLTAENSRLKSLNAQLKKDTQELWHKLELQEEKHLKQVRELKSTLRCLEHELEIAHEEIKHLKTGKK